ncbi:Ig-like V-type domain-containing protein FAM187A isoform X1 [Synchiropus splendidus]|uniref:Ig-like V-type domain-containing protein FAM187A isoform X1 n=1 Tax=Synchiropus splendidus TaxID=270530 RepID=UPI00237DD263|nr:Ig-like V-type domain-containing protein FAM187A isoform X1 [Synchiropus splendidus]
MFFWLLLLSVTPDVRTYELPEGKNDVFIKHSCPAFLTFANVAYTAGVTVELVCLCKPQQVQSVAWFFRKHHEKPEQTRAFSRNTPPGSHNTRSHGLRSRLKIRLFKLLIRRAAVDDSGIYLCGSMKGDFFYAYDVDIQEAEMASAGMVKVVDQDMKRWGEPAPYQLTIAQQPWSVCDRCGVPGEQVRFGVCYVQSKYLHVRYHGSRKKMLSCGSGAVPGDFTGLRELKRAARVEVRVCNVTCPTPSKPKSSSNMQAIKDFLGLGSLDESAASLSFQNHPAESDLMITCPGARFNMAVAWDRGSEPIYRLKHMARSNDSVTPRITIDGGNNLCFKPAKVEDSGVYRCWLQGERAAEVHLLVHDLWGSTRSVLDDPEFWEALNTGLKVYGIMSGVFAGLLLTKTVVEFVIEPQNAHDD